MSWFNRLSLVVGSLVLFAAISGQSYNFDKLYEAKMAPLFRWETYFQKPSRSVQRVYTQIAKVFTDVGKLDSYEKNLEALDHATDLAFQSTNCLQLSKEPNKQAASLLKALKLKLSSNDCDLETFGLIRKNNFAAQDSPLGMAMREPILEFDKVLYRLFQGHGDRCSHVYLDRYYDALQRLDEKIFNTVRIFATGFLNGREKADFSWTRRLQHMPTAIIYMMNDKATPKIFMMTAFKSFESVVDDKQDARFTRTIVNERTGESSFDETKFANLFQKYVLSPCTAYVKEMGPIFIPAGFDLMAQWKNLKYPDADELFEFNKSLLYYRVCVRTIVDGEVYNKYKDYAISTPKFDNNSPRSSRNERYKF